MKQWSEIRSKTLFPHVQKGEKFCERILLLSGKWISFQVRKGTQKWRSAMDAEANGSNRHLIQAKLLIQAHRTFKAKKPPNVSPLTPSWLEQTRGVP
jgi:hypothetical protein